MQGDGKLQFCKVFRPGYRTMIKYPFSLNLLHEKTDLLVYNRSAFENYCWNLMHY